MFGRKADVAYVVFFAAHFVVTALFDSQHVAAGLAPSFAVKAQAGHIARTRDPLLSSSSLPWFTTFIWLELAFQMPCFVICSLGLWRNDKRVWPLTLLYAASSATTTLPCLVTILSTPAVDHIGLMAAYAPFEIIALVIAVDMLSRLTGLAGTAQSADRIAKRK